MNIKEKFKKKDRTIVSQCEKMYNWKIVKKGQG